MSHHFNQPSFLKSCISYLSPILCYNSEFKGTYGRDLVYDLSGFKTERFNYVIVLPY